jgi:hypothetical protein
LALLLLKSGPVMPGRRWRPFLWRSYEVALFEAGPVQSHGGATQGHSVSHTGAWFESENDPGVCC